MPASRASPQDGLQTSQTSWRPMAAATPFDGKNASEVAGRSYFELESDGPVRSRLRTSFCSRSRRRGGQRLPVGVEKNALETPLPGQPEPIDR